MNSLLATCRKRLARDVCLVMEKSDWNQFIHWSEQCQNRMLGEGIKKLWKSQNPNSHGPVVKNELFDSLKPADDLMENV